MEHDDAGDQSSSMEPGDTPNQARRPDSTVAGRLAAACRRHGVEYALGQSNPILFHLAAPAAGLKNITYRMENAGGAIADGYARVSRQVAVVTAQNGPAATLLVAPFAEALKSSVPIVGIVQEVPARERERNAFQEFDHRTLLTSCTKWVGRIDHPSQLEDLVDMAFRIATSGRCGPTALLLPADLLSEPAPEPRRRFSAGQFPLDPTVPAPDRIDEAADLVLAAERPVIIAGGGVHLSGAASALEAMQDAIHLPVATTLMGKGAVSDRHPLSIGLIGNILARGNRAYGARELVTEADLILLVGTRTAANGTDAWSQYPPDARFLHIDIDPTEIGRNYEAFRLLGDARLVLDALRARLLEREPSAFAARRPEIEALIAGATRDADALTRHLRSDDRTPIRPERLMAEIDHRIGPGTIVAADASYSSIWTTLCLNARQAGARFLVPRGLAGLGWGLPLAMGAQLARPDERVVCVVGDGGFAHVWGELETLRRHELPIIVIVLNNEVLAMQEELEVYLHDRHTDTRFSPVDHAAIARACGLHGVEIRKPGEIGPALDAAFDSQIATLLDVHVDPSARPPMTLYAELPSQFEAPRSRTEL